MCSKTNALGVKKEFKINIELYSEDIINQAISDFEEVFKPYSKPLLKGEWIEKVLEIYWDSEEEIDEIFNEFMNYCISLVNEK